MTSSSSVCRFIDSHAEGTCDCYAKSSGLYNQTLDELHFERSACGAAADGNVRKLRELVLKDHSNVNRGDGVSGLTPLHYAARNGKIPCVKLLLHENKSLVDVNKITTSGKATALMRAAYGAHEEIVKLLLKAGADASLKDADGETALHKAYKNKDKTNSKKSERERIVAALAEACPETKLVKCRRGKLPGEE